MTQRKRRIIIHSLNPKYHGIVTKTRGWTIKLTLTKLKNLLANEETLEEQILIISINNKDETLFTKKTKKINTMTRFNNKGENIRSRQGR